MRKLGLECLDILFVRAYFFLQVVHFIFIFDNIPVCYSLRDGRTLLCFSDNNRMLTDFRIILTFLQSDAGIFKRLQLGSELILQYSAAFIVASSLGFRIDTGEAVRCIVASR